MQERSHVKPAAVLIICYVAALAIATHWSKTAPKQEQIKTTRKMTVLQPVKKYLQTIEVDAYYCCISDLGYGDPKGSDVDIVSDGDPNDSKVVSINRNYPGDALVTFRLSGPIDTKGLSFRVMTKKGNTSDEYTSYIRFDKSGYADMEVQMRKGEVTNIIQVEPHKRTYF